MSNLWFQKKPYAPSGKVAVGTVQGLGERDNQQDSFAAAGKDCAENGFLAVVADGMGGLVNSGQVSSIVVSAMTDAFAPGGGIAAKEQLFALLKRAISEAAALTEDRNYQSGSTVTACILQHGALNWVSVGDSRVYLWRGGALIQLNRDHDLARDLTVMALADQMTLEAVQSNPRRESLTSYIGRDFPRYIDFNQEPLWLLRGDKIVLMTDGVYRALTQAELNNCLKKSAVKCAAAIEKKIGKKQLHQQDNFTAVILEIL